jgi:lipoprotein-releasing system permease protein
MEAMTTKKKALIATVITSFVFYINRFPSEVHLNDVITVAISAFFLVVIASIYPAKRAGKLQISEVLNHE